jgi:hypothetical protein
VAFIRVQTGVFDPTIIGDKHKWFGHQLDAIHFKVWNNANHSLNQLFLSFDSLVAEESSDENSGDDSDISTSSSYSSLSDLVDELYHKDSTQLLCKYLQKSLKN